MVKEKFRIMHKTTQFNNNNSWFEMYNKYKIINREQVECTRDLKV